MFPLHSCQKIRHSWELPFQGDMDLKQGDPVSNTSSSPGRALKPLTQSHPPLAPQLPCPQNQMILSHFRSWKVLHATDHIVQSAASH